MVPDPMTPLATGDRWSCPNCQALFDDEQTMKIHATTTCGLANAPESVGDDVAQCEIVTRHVLLLEGVVNDLRDVADEIFDGHLTAEGPDEDNAEPYCFECDVVWPCARARLAASLAEVTDYDDPKWNRSAVGGEDTVTGGTE